MRKQCIVIVMIAFLLLALGTLITAFFLDYESYENDVVLGKVRVRTELYYEKDGETYPGAEVVIDPANNIKKKGIYHINVVDRESVEFIENVRISVVVESDVDTYIRIKLLDQMGVDDGQLFGRPNGSPDYRGTDGILLRRVRMVL